MNAVLDALGPQRSEKGTGLREVSGAKENWRGIWEMGGLWGTALEDDPRTQARNGKTNPTLSQNNIQAAMVLVEIEFRGQIMLGGWDTPVSV